MNESERHFERYRKYLTNEAQRLTGYIAVYRTLQERKGDRLEEMNTAPAFFTTVIDALFSAIILWTDKMFDEKSERGLTNLLKFCEQHRRIFTVKELQRRRGYADDHWMICDRADVSYQAIQDHHQRIAGRPWLRSIRIRRDKFHGHFDGKYFFNRGRIASEAPLTYDDLADVVRTMDEILNFYSTAYDGEIFGLGFLNITDLNDLLNQLHQKPTP